ncbi:MAG: DNA-3-methyladenine glycosylase [Bacteroidales bacterium]|nr:DNA-3-methyladenine glycosylase [Bacteroidales bacterium]
MISGKHISKSFYLQDDVVEVARRLLGKVLVTNFDDCQTSGIIVETEAYAGLTDRASHAYGGKITRRNEVMYREGGIAYVYLCYGIHSLFNVVTNVRGVPHAVLIRAIIPLDGMDRMIGRLKSSKLNVRQGIGPGNVCKLLGIHYSHSGFPLTGEGSASSGLHIWIEDRGELFPGQITAGQRIGVDYAGEDASLPYRFCLEKQKAP